jgi:hypothetical protein
MARRLDYRGSAQLEHQTHTRTVQMTVYIDQRPDGFGGMTTPEIEMRVTESVLTLLGDQVTVTIPGRRPFVGSIVSGNDLVMSDDVGYPFTG